MVRGAATSRWARPLVAVVLALVTVACSSASTGSKPTTTVNRSGSTGPKPGANPGIVGAPFSGGSQTTAAGQPGASTTTAPAAGGPGAGTAPGSTAPPPPPQGLKQVGDVCSPAGATAYTDTGKLLLCGAQDDNGQFHWRAGRG